MFACFFIFETVTCEKSTILSFSMGKQKKFAINWFDCFTTKLFKAFVFSNCHLLTDFKWKIAVCLVFSMRMIWTIVKRDNILINIMKSETTKTFWILSQKLIKSIELKTFLTNILNKTFQNLFLWNFKKFNEEVEVCILSYNLEYFKISFFKSVLSIIQLNQNQKTKTSLTDFQIKSSHEVQDFRSFRLQFLSENLTETKRVKRRSLKERKKKAFLPKPRRFNVCQYVYVWYQNNERKSNNFQLRALFVVEEMLSLISILIYNKRNALLNNYSIHLDLER